MTYEELQKRLFYFRLVKGRGEHRQSFNGFYIVYHTCTGNTTSSSTWLIPGTEDCFDSLEGRETWLGRKLKQMPA